MFRKAILSTMTVVVLATSAVSLSAPTASAGSRESRIVAGAVFGVAAALLAANAYGDERPSGHRKHRYVRYEEADVCFEKPIRRYDPDYGHKVIVGYKTVCR